MTDSHVLLLRFRACLPLVWCVGPWPTRLLLQLQAPVFSFQRPWPKALISLQTLQPRPPWALPVPSVAQSSQTPDPSRLLQLLRCSWKAWPPFCSSLHLVLLQAWPRSSSHLSLLLSWLLACEGAVLMDSIPSPQGERSSQPHLMLRVEQSPRWIRAPPTAFQKKVFMTLGWAKVS